MGKLCRSFFSLRVSLFDFCGLRFCFVQLAPFEVSPSTFPPFEFFMDSFSHPKPKQRSLEIFRFSEVLIGPSAFFPGGAGRKKNPYPTSPQNARRRTKALDNAHRSATQR